MSSAQRLALCDLSGGTAGLALDYRSQLTAAGRPVVQACTECGRVQFPPMLRCASCRSAALAWVDGGERGVIASFVIVSGQEQTRGYSIPKHLAERLPYTTVFVGLAAHDGLRVPGLLAGEVPLDAVAIGLPVRLSVAGDSRPVLVATP